MKIVFEWSKAGDGNMSLKYGDQATVNSNRQKFFSRLGLDLKSAVKMSLSGGAGIKEVTGSDAGKMLEVDALVTREKNLPLFMVVGDCFPVAFWEPEKNIIALVHLGYQGILAGLAGKIVEWMKNSEIDPAKLMVKIGPGARKESYKWDPEIVIQRKLPGWGEFLETDEKGLMHIDLAGYLKRVLAEHGIKAENIDDCGIDTIADPDYFSHYRVKRNGGKEERFGVVGMMI